MSYYLVIVTYENGSVDLRAYGTLTEGECAIESLKYASIIRKVELVKAIPIRTNI